MIKYKIRGSDWLTFPLIIVNFNHFFIQPVPGVPRLSHLRIAFVFSQQLTKILSSLKQ